jgi:chitinase
MALAKKRGVKVLVSVGQRNTPWMKAAGDPALLAHLAGNIARFLEANGYDGLDVDWEPMPRDEEQGRAHAAFLRAMRAALPGRLLTVDTSAPRFIRWNDVASSVDWIHLMGYDYHGWEEHAGHNAPLYPTSRFKDPCGEVSVFGTVEAYLGAHGIPPGKLLLGLPFYGHSFPGPGLYLKSEGESRLWTYTDVWHLLSRPDVVRAYDPTARVPSAHARDGRQHVSYDDAESLAAKVAYARSKGLGGVFLWALGFDEVEPGTMPLAEAVKKAVLN